MTALNTRLRAKLADAARTSEDNIMVSGIRSGYKMKMLVVDRKK